MFRPNAKGLIYRKAAKRDIHGRESFADPVTLDLAVVSLRDKVESTSVRADSSASRGSADQEVLQAKLLVGFNTVVSKGDVIKVHGRLVEIESINQRIDVFGSGHHLELGGNIKGDM